MEGNWCIDRKFENMALVDIIKWIAENTKCYPIHERYMTFFNSDLGHKHAAIEGKRLTEVFDKQIKEVDNRLNNRMDYLNLNGGLLYFGEFSSGEKNSGLDRIIEYEEKSDRRIRELEAKIEKIQDKIDSVNLPKASFDKVIQNLENKLERLLKELEDLENSKTSSEEIDSDIDTLKKKIYELEKKVKADKLQNSYKPKVVEDKKINEMENKLKEMFKKLEDLEVSRETAEKNESRAEELREKTEELQSTIDSAKENHEERAGLQKEINELENKRKKLLKEIKNLESKDSDDNKSEIKKLKEESDKLKEEIENLKNKKVKPTIAPSKSRSKSKTKESNSSAKEIEKMEKNLAKTLKEVDDLANEHIGDNETKIKDLNKKVEKLKKKIASKKDRKPFEWTFPDFDFPDFEMPDMNEMPEFGEHMHEVEDSVATMRKELDDLENKFFVFSDNFPFAENFKNMTKRKE